MVVNSLRRSSGVFVGAIVVLFSFLALPLHAQEDSAFRNIEVEARNSLIKGSDLDEWDLVGIGVGELDFQSGGSRRVRSRLNIRAEVAEVEGVGSVARFSVPRAFIRMRLPVGEEYLFRTTVGRSRVTWGDGALYNAGDLVFGTEGRRADLLSTSSIRDETDWLITAFLPLGRFSFIEPVILVPDTDPGLAPAPVESPDRSDEDVVTGTPSFPRTAGGSRIQWKLWNIKMETAYLYRGGEEEHDGSFSFQGNLGPDVYGGVAGTVGKGVGGYDELRFTGGLFHQQRYGSVSAFSLRLEALFEPGSGEAADELSFFPEITWSPSDSVALFGRVLVATVDPSALWIAGGEWNIYQGLTLGSYVTVQSGSSSDRYGFDRFGGASITSSVRYLF